MTEASGNTALEKSLAESELRLRQVIDAMPHMVWMATTDGTCDFLSKRWEEYTGIALDVQFGNAWTQQLHPDDRKMVLAHWQQAVAAGADFHFNCRIRRYDGVYRWFETRGLPLRDSQGRIVKWFGTNTDVHETHETREALAQNEGRLRYVTLATHDSVYDWDMPSGYTYRNDEFQNVFGAPPRTRSSDRWWENRIHPDDRKRVVESATVAFRAHAPKWSDEYRLKRADGVYANVKDRSYLLYDANGKPTRMIGAIEDITERKHVEQSLRDARARLISAMEAGGLATWIWDVRTNEMLWDEAACRLWGQPPGEFEKFNLSKIRQVIQPDDLGRLIESTAEFRRTGVETAVEFRTLRPDGALQWLLSKGQVEFDASGQAIRMAGVYIDITHRKQIEEAQLRTQKMEALGTLAGGIAHDFNNILLAIAGNAKLAAADLSSLLLPNHPVRRNLAEIDKASARAADLVRRILTFSRQQETQHDVLPLRPLIEEALRLLRPTLPAIVEIRTAFADNVGSVSTDAIQIHQVVMNLVTNAAHAIGEGRGTIEITLNEKNIETQESNLGALSSGRYACLTVRDTGSGIESAIVDRIFDPFFTTKKAGQGTGLGLAVVHGIVKAHGGAIVVDSEIGRGTTFAVYFPTAAAQLVQKIDSLPTSSPMPLSSEGGHVLYVDDEEALVFLTAKVLERLGYRVTGCVDPELALKELRAHPQSFDVLVTDLSMRGMNGFELTREAHRIRGDLPVLLTSGYLRGEDRETAQQAGIREMILKPNSVEELGQAINRALIELRTGMPITQAK